VESGDCGKKLCGDGVNQMAGCRVYQQLKVLQEIHTVDGELDLGQQKR
jgi:hypothetical protein